MKYLMLSLLFLVVGAFPASGQAAVEKTYISDDGSFRFRYADEISVDVSSTFKSFDVGAFYVSEDEPIRVQVSPPTSLAAFSEAGLGSTAREVLVRRLGLWRSVAAERTAQVIDLPSDVAFNGKLAGVTQTTIAGRPVTQTTQVFPIDTQHTAAVKMMAVRVGGGRIVLLTASPSLAGGGDLLERYADDVNAIVRTVEYDEDLNASQSASAPLRRNFTGDFGRLQIGEITFGYPKDWYILQVNGSVLVTNTQRLLADGVEPGMVQASLISPDFNKTAFGTREAIARCELTAGTRAAITPASVLERQMLSEARLASMDAQGARYDEPQTLRLGGRDAAYMRLYTPDRDALVIAVDMGQGNVVSLMSFAAPGEMPAYDDTLFALASSLEYDHQGCAE